MGDAVGMRDRDRGIVAVDDFNFNADPTDERPDFPGPFVELKRTEISFVDSSAELKSAGYVGKAFPATFQVFHFSPPFSLRCFRRVHFRDVLEKCIRHEVGRVSGFSITDGAYKKEPVPMTTQNGWNNVQIGLTLGAGCYG